MVVWLLHRLKLSNPTVNQLNSLVSTVMAGEYTALFGNLSLHVSAHHMCPCS